MFTVARIVRKFGGLKRMSVTTGFHVATLSHWKNKGGYVPAKHQRAILEAGIEAGLNITANDVICNGCTK